MLKNVCEKNPDVFLLFFGTVFEIDENLAINQEVLNTVRAIIETEKMSPYMMNFAGYLKLSYDIPYARAMAAFKSLCMLEKKCTYILVYLLRNYPEQFKEVAEYVG